VYFINEFNLRGEVMEVTVKPFENYQGQTITQVRLKNNQGVEISCCRKVRLGMSF